MTTQFSPELHGQYKAKAYAAANAKSAYYSFHDTATQSGRARRSD
jgi:hypothetical protein